MRNRKPSFQLNAPKIIINDPYLTLVYNDIYKEFYLNSGANIDSKVLELGSGGLSFAKNYWKDVTISDIDIGIQEVESRAINAEILPFADETFDVIIAKDALHHFKDPLQALSEIFRVLKRGGSFQISEPYWSFFGKIIFKYLHSETWDTKVSTLIIKSEDPWESNQALLLLLTDSFSSELKKKLPQFHLKLYSPTYALSYLISGGVFTRTLVPAKYLIFFYKFEKKFMRIYKRIFALNVLAGFNKL